MPSTTSMCTLRCTWSMATGGVEAPGAALGDRRRCADREPGDRDCRRDEGLEALWVMAGHRQTAAKPDAVAVTLALSLACRSSPASAGTRDRWFRPTASGLGGHSIPVHVLLQVGVRSRQMLGTVPGGAGTSGTYSHGKSPARCPDPGTMSGCARAAREDHWILEHARDRQIGAVNVPVLVRRALALRGTPFLRR
jgi:hypothetical protein